MAGFRKEGHILAQMLVRSVQINAKKCLETSDVKLLFRALLSDVARSLPKSLILNYSQELHDKTNSKCYIRSY